MRSQVINLSAAAQMLSESLVFCTRDQSSDAVAMLLSRMSVFGDFYSDFVKEISDAS